MAKRKPAYAAFLVIGLGLIPLAIAGNTAFLGVSVTFLVIGAAGLIKERRSAESSRDRSGS